MLPLGWFWQASLLPDSYDLSTMGYPDWGGGPQGHHDHQSGVPVASLTADPDTRADVRETVTVRREPDGGYTVNGTSPGPLLEATVGDLVEVTLVNENITEGTTLHWHGVDVPNAADGVAGVTQDAVGPGEEFVYRFVAEQAGTFWYHSHQLSHEQVRRGLLGGLVVHPSELDPDELQQVAVLHEYESGPSLNGTAGVTTVDAEPGQRVRVRVVNTDNGETKAWVTGAPYQVVAVDGTDLNDPGQVEDRSISIPAGGRVDLSLVVPEGGARVDFGGTTALVLGGDPTDGSQASPPWLRSTCSRTASRPTSASTRSWPTGTSTTASASDPAFSTVGRGCGGPSTAICSPTCPCSWSRRATSWSSRSRTAATTHTRCTCTATMQWCFPATASPPPVHRGGWTPSRSRQVSRYEVAFVADNPGLWMDHCHNLPHAAEGLVAHLMYDGVSSSYVVGGNRHNQPE